MEFTAQGTNGFSIEVGVDDRRRLTLGATKQGNGLFDFEGMSYELPIRPLRGSDAIKARIGRLGRIDVRFVPNQVKERSPPRICRGGKTIVEIGHFVGLIAFRGERGVTRVRAHRAAGVILKRPALSCRSHRSANKNRKREGGALKHLEDEVEAVQLVATRQDPRVFFVASRVAAESSDGKTQAKTSFAAIGSRNRGRIKEAGLAFEVGEPGADFRLPEPLAPTDEALVEPPAPFSGSATYRSRSPKSATWSGDLKVDLPGFGPVRLAGSGTHAEMCEGFTCGSALDRRTSRLIGLGGLAW